MDDEFENAIDGMRAAHLDECAAPGCAVCAAIWQAARADAAEGWSFDHEAMCDDGACPLCLPDTAHAVVPVD